MARLSVQEQIALIYTSAGSMRNTAALIGISHQKVGRILRAGEPGQLSPKSKSLNDPGLINAVHSAFQIHKDITREQARIDKLPFNPDAPIFIQRLVYTPWDNVPTGYEIQKMTPRGPEWVTEYHRRPQRDASGKLVEIRGDRVLADHTHWISDKLRNRWLDVMRKTSAFLNVSIGSLISIVDYPGARIEELLDTIKNDTIDKAIHAAKILNTIEQNIRLARVFTPMQGMAPSFRLSDLTYNLDKRLTEKHQPATGKPGTRLGDQILLQVDSRKKSNADFRAGHPIPAKRRKAAGNQKRAR